MSENAIIVCENLVKIYSHSGVEVVALQGLDLAVDGGEILGLVGASGSGKSTLMNVLGGLDRPSAGRVIVGGRELLKLNDAELDRYRRTQVGFVWQQTTRNLVPYLSALENVQLPMRLTRASLRARRQRSLELLDAVGMSHRIKHHPVQLSGGEQQRVAIAVALANQPTILLADEPTGEVDTATALDIYAALRQVNQRYQMTTIIVSHDPTISHHTDRVVAIRDGKTSAEVVKSVAVDGPAGNQRPDHSSAMTPARVSQIAIGAHFEELIVLDSAGRLQIPRDYLEALNIGDRVRVELESDHITLHPVAGRGRAATTDAGLPSPEELYTEEDAAPQPARPSLFTRVRRTPK